MNVSFKQGIQFHGEYLGFLFGTTFDRSSKIWNSATMDDISFEDLGRHHCGGLDGGVKWDWEEWGETERKLREKKSWGEEEMWD